MDRLYVAIMTTIFGRIDASILGWLPVLTLAVAVAWLFWRIRARRYLNGVRVILFPLVVYFLMTSAEAKGGPITIGYLSFSSGPDGENTSFSLSNITDEDFQATELIFRGQLGGEGGDGNYYTIVSQSTHVFNVGGGLFQWGEVDGELPVPDFTVGSVEYQTSANSFQAFLYSDAQFYLGPGQATQIAVTVEGEVVTPEPRSSWLLATGITLLLIGSRIIPRFCTVRHPSRPAS